MSTHVNSNNNSGGLLMTLAVLILVVLIAVWYMNLPGHRTFGERVGDAIDDTPHATHRLADKVDDTVSSGKASSAAEKVDTALRKTGDAASTAVAEVGNDIKAAVNKQKQQNAAHKKSADDSDDQ